MKRTTLKIDDDLFVQLKKRAASQGKSMASLVNDLLRQAIDTNILVFAEIRTSENHTAARKTLTDLAEGAVPWAIPWPCVYEFLRVVTHPRVYHPPVPMKTALQDLRRILGSPTLILLRETANHPEVMISVIQEAGVSGNLVHDAHIAALSIEHGISEFIKVDRDFSRFPSLSVKNPFLQKYMLAPRYGPCWVVS